MLHRYLGCPRGAVLWQWAGSTPTLYSYWKLPDVRTLTLIRTTSRRYSQVITAKAEKLYCTGSSLQVKGDRDKGWMVKGCRSPLLVQIRGPYLARGRDITYFRSSRHGGGFFT